MYTPRNIVKKLNALPTSENCGKWESRIDECSCGCGHSELIFFKKNRRGFVVSLYGSGDREGEVCYHPEFD